MDEIVAKAARLAQGSNPQSALPLLETVLKAAPDHADALTLRGLVAQRTGQHEDAVAAFSSAREAEPENPARLVNLGLALKAARQFEAAVALLREADAMRPGHAGTLANLGSCLIAAGRAENAVPVLERAVALAPGNAGAANNLGIARARGGDRSGAVAAYEAALAIRTDYHAARLNLADSLHALGRTAEAEICAQKVLDAQPGHPRAANLLGMIREQEGDSEEALAVWHNSLARAGASHPVGVNLMRVLIATGRAREVPAVAQMLLKALPQSTTPLAYLAAALDRLEESEELARLTDPSRFVRIIDIKAPAGFSSLDTFHHALRGELRAHPSLVFEPAGLVTRKGRQSGDLAEAKTPALAAMTGSANAALRELWSDLGGENPDHPFIAARPQQWTTTLWGTILRPGGAVEPHIHAPNWLSGVYYPGFAQGGTDSDEGAFAIGTLPEALGGGGTQTVIRPRPGRMVLFPSFLWHATLPFGGRDERLSIAFDLVPHGIGRPHRLNASPATR